MSHYLLNDWTKEPLSDTDPNEFISCRHVAAAVSDLTHTLFPSILDSIDHQYQTHLIEELLFRLQEPPEEYLLNSWMLCEWLYHTEKGKLLLFLTDVGQLVIAAQCKSTSNAQYYHCFKCPAVRNCSHVALLPRITTLPHYDYPLARNPKQNEQLGSYDALLLSKELYPMDIKRDQELCRHITFRNHYGVQKWLEQECPDKLFTAEISFCCGYSCERAMGNHSSTEGIVEVFGLSSWTHVNQIERRICRECGRVYSFDGRSLGLLNVGNRFLFCVEVILDILEFKANNGTPVHSYWKSRVNTLLRTFKKEKVSGIRERWMNMTGRVNEVVTQFLKLVRYPSETFQCCPNPQVLCIDGIVLSVESRRLQENKAPWRDDAQVRGRFNTRAQRSLVPGSIKSLLKEFGKVGITITERNQIKTRHADNPVVVFVLENGFEGLDGYLDLNIVYYTVPIY